MASAQESSPAPAEAPAAPTVPTPTEEKKEEKAPAPPALPGAAAPVEPLSLQAPGLTAPPAAPGLGDRFQRRLQLLPPGQLLFDLSVEEEYDDNAFRLGGRREADFRTVIVPAVALERKRGRSSLSLRYTPRIFEYVRFPELNRVDQSLVAAGSWNPTPRLRASVRESLLITEDPVESSALGIREVGLRRTTRNEVSPAFEIKLTNRSDLGLQYTNTVTDVENAGGDEGDDRTIHSGRIGLRRRFKRGGVSLAYTLTSADFTESADFLGHEGTLNTTWRLNPKNELLLGAGGVFRDRKGDRDFTVVTGNVGLNHQFSRRLQSTTTAGFQRFKESGSDPTRGFFTDSSLTWKVPRGSLTVRVERRFTESFNDIDNQGVIDVLRGSASFSYQVGPRLSFAVTGSFAREDFEEQDRQDLINSVSVDVRYRLTRVLFLSMGYRRFDRNSDGAGEDLTTNRVFLGLSLRFSTPLPF